MARVRVDPQLCNGHGRCYMLAPEIYGADDAGHCVVLRPEVGEDLLEAANRGAVNCPERAIAVESDGSPSPSPIDR